MRGAKALVKILEKEEIDCMFGYPGAATIPIYDELLGSGVHHVLVRHEQCAAHMADGFARASGRPGVCMATSGPGSTNLVTGVATAYADSSPMLVLTGQVSTAMLGNEGFQEADTFSMMMPITKHNYRVLDPNQIPEAIRRGLNIAKSGRMGPVHVDLPIDIINGQVKDELIETEYPVPSPPEDFTGMFDAARTLLQAERPVILAGGGAIWANAGPEVQAMAEKLLAPVITTLLGKGIINEEHPLSLGMLGMHGRESARHALIEADVILAIGTRFSDRTIPNPNDLPLTTRMIHIDADAAEARRNPRTKVSLVGDAKKALQQLSKSMALTKSENAWSARVREMRARCRCQLICEDVPINPKRAMYELAKMLDDDMLITTEVGQNQMWAAHFIKVRHPRQFITSGGMGTMGFGLPAAIGAKIARPDKKVVDVAGDGSLMMVFQELATAMSEELPVVILLLNNGWLGMVRQWQKLFWDRRYSGTSLGRMPDFVALAEAYGADAVRVERPSELREAYERALASDVPFLVDVICDPEADMLPMIPSGKSSKDMVKGSCVWACDWPS